MSKAPYSHKYYIITFLLQERAHLCQGFGGQRERERERESYPSISTPQYLLHRKKYTPPPGLRRTKPAHHDEKAFYGKYSFFH
jgi:hypothetical protein